MSEPRILPSNQCVTAEQIAEYRELVPLGSLVGVGGKLLAQLLDDLERNRAALERIVARTKDCTIQRAASDVCAIARAALSGDSSAPHDALRTDDDPLKPPVEGPSQVETPKPSKNESVRQKFDAWYASPHGEAEFTLGMHYFGWAYTSYAAGYKQAALDLGRSLPVETRESSKEEIYRNALASIRDQTRSDPADIETAVGDLRSIYDIANMALFAGGAGFTSPVETTAQPLYPQIILDRLRQIANLIDSRPVMGHWPAMMTQPDADFLRSLADALKERKTHPLLAESSEETSPSPGANLCHWARCHQPKAPGEAFLCAEHAWQRDNGTLPNPDYDTSEADAPKSGAWPVVSAEEAKHPLAFRHWSKDPAIPYPGCHCATCSAQKASACVHEWEDGWCAKCGKKFGEKTTLPPCVWRTGCKDAKRCAEAGCCCGLQSTASGPKPDAEKAPVISADPCPTGDWVHEEHNGKCVYCGAPMSSQSKAEPEFLTVPERYARPPVKASDERVCQCATYCMDNAGMKWDPPVKCRGLTGPDPGAQGRFK